MCIRMANPCCLLERRAVENYHHSTLGRARWTGACCRNEHTERCERSACGFRPVDGNLRPHCTQLLLTFFCCTFDKHANARFLQAVLEAFERKGWKRLVKGFLQAKMARIHLAKSQDEDDAVGNYESAKSVDGKMRHAKRQVTTDGGTLSSNGTPLSNHRSNLKVRGRVEQSFAFAFVEGALVTALRKGQWIF